jgi:hypothetical protein
MFWQHSLAQLRVLHALPCNNSSLVVFKKGYSTFLGFIARRIPIASSNLFAFGRAFTDTSAVACLCQDFPLTKAVPVRMLPDQQPAIEQDSSS